MVQLTARQVFHLLENNTLWELAERVHQHLSTEAIAHAIVGGIAVCLHGYQRNTIDLDLLVEPKDTESLRSAFAADGITCRVAEKKFRSDAGLPIQCVLAGESEGHEQEARFPSPSDPKSVTTIEGLPVLSLASLIQSKIACGLGNLRRTNRDFADVVELIAIHDLDGPFARFLHKSVRKEYRALVRRAKGSK